MAIISLGLLQTMLVELKYKALQNHEIICRRQDWTTTDRNTELEERPKQSEQIRNLHSSSYRSPVYSISLAINPILSFPRLI